MSIEEYAEVIKLTKSLCKIFIPEAFCYNKYKATKCTKIEAQKYIL